LISGIRQKRDIYKSGEPPFVKAGFSSSGCTCWYSNRQVVESIERGDEKNTTNHIGIGTKVPPAREVNELGRKDERKWDHEPIL